MPLQVRNTRRRDGEHVWRTLDQYYQTYWSGLDARIYANEIELDEVVSLQYELQESLMPIFGYHSYTYERVHHGARRVQGQLTINFKRASYLFELLETLANPPRPAPTTDRNALSSWLARKESATVEDFIALAARGGQTITNDPVQAFQMDVSLLNQVADAFEGAFWTDAETRDRQVGNLVGRLLDRARIDRPRFEAGSGWDLTIKFGSSEPARILEGAQRAVSGPISPGMAGPVDPSEYQTISTTRRIVGVVLTGVGQVIDDSGKPILEAYTFIARDVI